MDKDVYVFLLSAAFFYAVYRALFGELGAFGFVAVGVFSTLLTCLINGKYKKKRG